MAGAEPAAEVLRKNLEIHERALPARIHLCDPGCEDEIGAAGFRKADVARERARVALIVVRAVELDRVDEDAHHNRATLGTRSLDQAAVAGMERAHGGHQADRLPGPAEIGHGVSQALNAAYERNAHLAADPERADAAG